MPVLLLLLVVGTGFEPHVVTDVCDVIELEHYHDADGKHVFSQLIFRDFSGERFAVRDFRLVKTGYSVSATGCVFSDAGTLRKVRGAVVEVWSQEDSELADRLLTSKECRRGLSPVLRKGR
jgi:hypothetical protein